uniref:ADP,ATP carrier protein n=1 Tax=Pseudictyota dubia TaxID=2749911 RepID=A0A7R9ZFS4_9STRA
MRDIIKKEGFGQLWSGTWASLVLVSNPAIQFFLYEQLKIYLVSSRFKRRRETGALGLLSLSAVEAFVVGAVAKGVATIITYPLQLAQVLLRLQKNQDANGIEGNSGSNSRGYTGTLDCIIQLSRNGGLQNLFSGMSAKLLQTVLTAAFTFLTYEQIVAAVQRTYMSLVFQR